MSSTFDLTSMSDTELDRLIDAAGRERATRGDPKAEAKPAGDGVRGQDVHDPNHGVITTPTPHHVREHGEAGLSIGARVEGNTIKP